ncbi:MAG: hypothetical protein KJO21_01570 [Verrucomicrobiae bacterium]|nr:hypothetical protein [Verrucomicrobiae bacterium]NNJ42224.1 hypothetical protein [Akkermansiaceae bacterium]
MKAVSLPKFVMIALSSIALITLSSCVDPNIYGGSGYGSAYYSSSSYSTLPYGYRTVRVSGTPYYYYGNSWYRRSSGRYISCSRPHGYHGTIGRHSYHHSRSITHSPHRYRSPYTGSSRYSSHNKDWNHRHSNNHYAKPYSSSKYSKHHRTGSSNYHSTSSRRSHVSTDSRSTRHKSHTYKKSHKPKPPASTSHAHKPKDRTQVSPVSHQHAAKKTAKKRHPFSKPIGNR